MYIIEDRSSLKHSRPFCFSQGILFFSGQTRGLTATLTGVRCLRVRCSDLLAGPITDLTVHSEGLEGALR